MTKEKLFGKYRDEGTRMEHLLSKANSLLSFEAINNKIVSISSSLWRQFFEVEGFGLFYWQHALIYIAILLVYFALNGGLTQLTAKFFPREIYQKQSILVDLQFYLADLFKIRRIVALPAVILTVIFLEMTASGIVERDQNKLILMSILGILGSEFGYYWAHRLAHRINFFWRFHLVHHYTPTLNPFVAVRIHFIDEWLLTIAQSLGAVLFVFIFFHDYAKPADGLFIIALILFFQRCFAIFTHCHVPISFGFLEYFFISPRLHQAHHSRDIYDKNFGNFLSVWDYMFGTLWRPNEPINYGVKGVPDDLYGSWLEAQWKPVADVAKVIYQWRTHKHNID